MPIHEKCSGCDHIRDGAVGPEENQDLRCNILATPLAQWTRIGGCAHRTHNLKSIVPTKPVFMDPLKASKMAMKKKAH